VLALIPNGRWTFLPFLLAIVVLVPVAVGIAVVRHDLYDVDRLLGDSAAWALTLVLSAALFGAVVLVASHALGAGIGIGPTAAAFVTALVLLPLHRSVAAFVARIVDRDRHVAVAAVERFTADVRAGRREPEEVEDALRGAQRDPELRLYLARPDGGWMRLDGSTASPTGGFTLETGGDPVARITLGWDSRRARRRIADREREVLALVAEGHSNTAVAASLKLSDRTVETHMRSIFAKLGLPDDGSTHRRVLAVVTLLEARAGQ
jgi:DNA-binding CsgD family transcriptional regulator